ncbi:MAG TPA: cytochrome c3 family protein [bacterium]
MKSGFILAVVLTMSLYVATKAFSDNVAATKHNLSVGSSETIRATTAGYDQICAFCHTPHGANSDKLVPLWNHTSSVQSFTPYNSSTFNGGTVTIGGATLACLSCHDGVTALNDIVNNPGSGAGTDPAIQGLDGTNSLNAGIPTNLGTDLSTSHPVGFVYATSSGADSDINPANTAISGWDGATTISGLLRSGNLECASCHNPHDNTNGMLLRRSNSNSAMCTTCHNK